MDVMSLEAWIAVTTGEIALIGAAAAGNGPVRARPGRRRLTGRRDKIGRAHV